MLDISLQNKFWVWFHGLMKYNPQTEEAYCFNCQAWLKLRTQCYTVGNQVRCLQHDHIVGYEHDAPEIYGDQKDE